MLYMCRSRGFTVAYLGELPHKNGLSDRIEVFVIIFAFFTR